MTQKPDSEGVATRREFLVSGAALVAAATLPVEAAAEGAASTPAPVDARSTKMSNSRITIGRENSTSIDLYYEDHGAGSPVRRQR